MHSHVTNEADKSSACETLGGERSKAICIKKSVYLRFLFYSVMSSHSANPKRFAHSFGFFLNFRLIPLNITTNRGTPRLKIH